MDKVAAWAHCIRLHVWYFHRLLALEARRQMNKLFSYAEPTKNMTIRTNTATTKQIKANPALMDLQQPDTDEY